MGVIGRDWHQLLRTTSEVIATAAATLIAVDAGRFRPAKNFPRQLVTLSQPVHNSCWAMLRRTESLRSQFHGRLKSEELIYGSLGDLSRDARLDTGEASAILVGGRNG